MNHKEEPSANSQRSSPSAQVDLYHPDDVGTETTGPLSRPGLTAAARAEKPALSEDADSLMERVVEEASPQGGPLSPLLSNILLDDLDKELERRGLPFVRYADDFAIFAKSERAADRILASISRYLTETLRLVVNQEKSRVRSSDELDQTSCSVLLLETVEKAEDASPPSDRVGCPTSSSDPPRP